MFRVRLLNADGDMLDHVGEFEGKPPANLKQLDGLPAAAFPPIDFTDVARWEALHEAERKLAASALKRPYGLISIE